MAVDLHIVAKGFEGGGVGVKEVVFVCFEHVVDDFGGGRGSEVGGGGGVGGGREGFAADAGEEFFGDAAAVDAGFILAEAVDEGDLDGFFEAVADGPVVLEGIFKFLAAADCSVLAIEVFEAVFVTAEGVSPEIGVGVAVSTCLLVIADELPEYFNSCGEGYEKWEVLKDFEFWCN